MPARAALAAVIVGLLTRTAAGDATGKPSDYQHAMCEMCGIFGDSLERTLNERKAELELPKDAAEKKQKRIDAVSKTQTRKWLQQEYAVELNLAIEASETGVCRNEKLRMDLCYTDPGDSALRKGGMVVQTELGESKTSISPINGPKGVASFSTIQVPGLEHIYEARTQCKERLKHRCDDVRSEVADDLVEGLLKGGSVDEICAASLPRCTTEISSMHRESLSAWLAEVKEQEMYQKEYEEEERVKARESREEEERKERKRQKRRAERRRAKAEAKAEL